MSSSAIPGIVEHLRRVAPEASCSDSQLLQELVHSQDEMAFCTLMQRHGPLVLHVCRRILTHIQDAEDAFQATFLVLAKKASTIRKTGSLAGWLHGVATRVSLRAQRSLVRRKRYESHSQPASEPSAAWEAARQEVHAILNEEIQRLPELYREPLILCYFYGLSKAEIAIQMELKEGTVSSRLAHARQVLREKLRHRGISMAGLLAALSITRQTEATVPTRLIEKTLCQAIALRNGSPVSLPPDFDASPKLSGNPMLTTPKIATGLVLILGLLTAGIIAIPMQAAVVPRAASLAPIQKAATDPRPPALKITGLVISSKNKPVAGVQLFLVSDALSTKKPQATTARNGSFEISIPKNSRSGARKLVAIHPDHGIEWVPLRSSPKPLSLRLPPLNERSIQGQILDLEGRPVPKVRILVERIGKEPDNKLKEWIDRNIALRKKGRYLNDEGLSSLRISESQSKWNTMTNAQGRFTIAGLGKDRVVRLKIAGDTTEHKRLWAVSRAGPQEGWIARSFGLYPERFRLLLSPCKPIIGTVRDRSSGKPVAGALVGDARRSIARTTTNEKGEFRLLGIGKRSSYILSLGGTPEAPYFGTTQFNISDTPGAEPLKVDFTLERGIIISGRLTDDLGQPIPGEVRYIGLPTNPELKKFKSFDGPRVIISRWGRVDKDGRFQVLGIPGPGLLAVLARDAKGFVQLDVERELRKRKVRSYPVGAVHRLVDIRPSEKDPGSRQINITLQKSRSIQGRALDTNGKPLPGVIVAGLQGGRASIAFVGREIKLPTLKEGHFTIVGMHPSKPRILAFYHPEKKLSRLIEISAKEKAPVDVHLQPNGSIQGRLLDAKGMPLKEMQIHLFPDLQHGSFEKLPADLRRGGDGSWFDRLWRITLTDAKGQFEIEDVIPGLSYQLTVTPEKGRRFRNVLLFQKDIQAESGKTKRLNDLKAPLRKP